MADVIARLTAPDGRFPLQNERVGDQVYKCFQSPLPRTLVQLFSKSSAREVADREFVVYQRERYTFRDVMEQANALASHLQCAVGIKPGDRVAIGMRNLPEFIVAYVAITTIGGVAVLLNAWWTSKELLYGLVDSGSVSLVVDQERLERATPHLSVLNLLGKTIVVRPRLPVPTGVVDYAALLATLPVGCTPTPVLVREDDLANIVYTSGTTADPKGVMLTHRGITSAVNMQALNWAISKEKNPTDLPPNEHSILLNVPLFHVTGTHVIFLPCFLYGRKLVMMYKWDVEEAMRLVQAERLTIFNGVPTMSWELLNSDKLPAYDLTSLRAVGGGGAPTPPQLIQLVYAKLPHATPNQGYGLCETNSITTSNSGLVYKDHPRSCGLPVLNVEVGIFTPCADGTPLPVGEVGEIWIRGPTLMRGYWGKPDKTEEVLVRDKHGKLWFRSGDIGRMCEEGFVYILDREKDLVNRGGEKISCAEVESGVLEHPAVVESAVFALPDPRLGEVVGVAIVVRPGVPAPALDELQRACSAAGLSKFKLPSHMWVWPHAALPRGATGKTLKREVREWAVKQYVLKTPSKL